MRASASLAVGVDQTVLYSVVRDLTTYPEWLDIVHTVAELPAVSHDSAVAAYRVDLRAQLGPLHRSKRLRMERVRDDGSIVQFDRRELDGRDHPRWQMTCSVSSNPSGSIVEVELTYEGSLWVPLLDRALSTEIERSKSRLVSYVIGAHKHA